MSQEVLHIHDAIRGNLASFAAEARSLEVALSPGGALGASQLGSLVERHRFLRAVCSCHTASEAYVLLPAARALCQGTATNMQVEPCPVPAVPATSEYKSWHVYVWMYWRSTDTSTD